MLTQIPPIWSKLALLGISRPGPPRATSSTSWTATYKKQVRPNWSSSIPPSRYFWNQQERGEKWVKRKRKRMKSKARENSRLTKKLTKESSHVCSEILCTGPKFSEVVTGRNFGLLPQVCNFSLLIRFGQFVFCWLWIQLTRFGGDLEEGWTWRLGGSLVSLSWSWKSRFDLIL